MSEMRADARELLARAVAEIDRLRARVAEEGSAGEPIAVVGLGCRFPGGASSPDLFRIMLREGRDGVGTLPAWRGGGENGVGAAGSLQDVDLFDDRFFGISPREAAALDPQQRLLLEVAWEALEHAGTSPSSLRHTRTGVYVGIGMDDYGKLRLRAGGEAAADPYAGTGSGFCFAAGRISHTLGLHGPSLSLDTACSSSLVAVHLACQSLRAGESDLALAGGVNLILTADVSTYLSGLKALSPTGRCRTFDASADGYVRGEGCGLVVLERLSDALARRDRIEALILGSAVNHDGPSSGLTVPNGRAQESLIREALEAAGVAPDDVGMVEAHGTGTPLGDPIEVGALARVFGGRPAHRPLTLGSVKTNIGHLETGAGVASLIRAVLAVRDGELHPHLHFQEANPEVDLERAGARVVRRLSPWPASYSRRVAGVSAFGLSGTNAHLVVAQAPGEATAAGGQDARSEPAPERPSHLLVLSSRTDDALRAQAEAWARHPALLDGALLADVCHTASVGRAHGDRRLALRLDADGDPAGVTDALARAGRGEGVPGAHLGGGGRAPRVAFLFTGQGAQLPGMGRELFETQPVYRAAVERCAAAADGLLDVDLVTLLHEADAALLKRTRHAQPALFSLEYALAELWRSWGIRPAAVLGHSLGEYVAACVAGVLSPEDALTLVIRRAAAMDALPEGGRMVAFTAPEAVVAEAVTRVGGPLSVAAVNGPMETVASGSGEAVAALVANLAEHDVGGRDLEVSHAFHSPLVEPALEALETAAREVHAGLPELDLVSNETGRPATRDELRAPGWWSRHARSPVRFADGLASLRALGCDTFLEIGPAPVLSALGRRTLDDETLRWIPSLRPRRGETDTMLDALASLWVAGAEVEWAAFDGPWRRRKLALPTYPFQRRRHWLPEAPEVPEPSSPRSAAGAAGTGHPLVGRPVPSPLEAVQFEVVFDARKDPLVAEHRVYGDAVVSGPTEISMVLEAATRAFGEGGVELAHVAFVEPLVLPPDDARVVQVVFEAAGDGHAFRVTSRAAEAPGPWVVHTTGRLAGTEPSPPEAWEPRHDGAALLKTGSEISGDDLHRTVQTEVGFEFGPGFRWVDRIWRDDGEALGCMRPATAEDGAPDLFVLHPGLHDSCYQVFGAASGSVMRHERAEAVIPVGVDEVRFHGRPQGPLWCRARLWPGEAHRPDMFAGDFTLYEEGSGRVFLEVRGLRLRRASRDTVLRGLRSRREARVLVPTWVPASLPDGAGDARWLLLDGDAELGAAVAEHAREAGHRVLRASPDDPGWTAPLEEDGTSDWRVVLLPPTDEAASETAAGELEDLVRHRLLEVLGQVRALARTAGPSVRVWLVTRGARAVRAGDTVRLREAALHGMAAAAAVEHAEIWGGVVDIAMDGASGRTGHGIFRACGAADERRWALRDGQALVERLRPPDGQAAPEASPTGPPHPVGGGYLITGGAGALGMATARWLLTRGAREVVLMSRSEPGGAAAEALAELDGGAPELGADGGAPGPGARVRWMQGDVTSHEDVVAAVDALENGPGGLRGVVHAAGTVDDGALVDFTEERVRRHLAVKATGAWNLHLATRDLPLTSFVLFSSAAGVLGSPGQGVYGAANAVLDGLAHLRRSQGLPALSLNWGAWEGAGMAEGLGERGTWSTSGLGALSAAEALDTLGSALERGLAQAVVVRADWTVLDRWLRRGRGDRFLEAVVGGHGSGGSPSVGHGAPPRPPEAFRATVARASDEAREGMVVRRVQEVVARVLGETGSDLPDPARGFFEMGMDSLMAVELRSRLQGELGEPLPPTVVLDHPSVTALAGFLLGRWELPEAAEASEGSGPRETPPGDDASRDGIAAMTEREAKRLLLEELKAFDAD